MSGFAKAHCALTRGGGREEGREGGSGGGGEGGRHAQAPRVQRFRLLPFLPSSVLRRGALPSCRRPLYGPLVRVQDGHHRAQTPIHSVRAQTPTRGARESAGRLVPFLQSIQVNLYFITGQPVKMTVIAKTTAKNTA